MPITWILYRTELGLCFLRVRWPVISPAVMEYAGSGPVGLSKPPSHEFRLKYLSNPYIINKQTTTCINCAKRKCINLWCNNRNASNKFSPFIFMR